MLWVSAVLIAVVSNLDNLAAGLALGMRDTRVRLPQNTVIAVITMAGTAGAMSFGGAVSRLMPLWLGSTLGASIIVAIGGWTLVQGARRPVCGSCVPRRRGTSHQPISWPDALVLGVALSLNNVGSGVGAGLAGIPPLATTLLAGAFSLLCVGGGSRIGWSLGQVIGGRGAQIAAGSILVGLGLATLSGAG